MTQPQNPNPQQNATPEIPVDWSTEPTPAYVSGAHVAHTVRDFAVLFDEAAGFPGRNAPASAPQSVRARIVASLRLTPDTFFQVVCALASSWNRYSQRYMASMPMRPRFKLVGAGDAQLEATDDPPQGPTGTSGMPPGGIPGMPPGGFPGMPGVPPGSQSR